MKQLNMSLTYNIKRMVYASLAASIVSMTIAPYVLADSMTPTATSPATACSPVTPTSGTQQPTGSAAPTYTYNTCTGLWENQYYTWSPVTKEYTPKQPYVYTCDTTAWDWTYHKWLYVASSGTFTNVLLATSQLPAGAVIAPGSRTTCTPPPPPVPIAQPGAANVTTPTAGSNGITGTNTSNDTLNATSGVTITNQINSTGMTGNAALMGNTSAGDATSGNATVTANVINNVASSSSLSNGNVVTFTANVNGDVQGDLIIDPNQIQPASNGNTLTNNGNVTVNAQTSGAVTNNLTLNAATGNASAKDNTSAGNVTTGNAQAIADVINVLDSVVKSGKSFVGVININGNLHGNILMPQSFLDKLLATNAPHTNMTISASDATTLGINNNVNNTATSGSATADSNTSTGNIATGNAATAVTIFNLTGSQIVGSNCLLVFVNVSGQWVGVIMNAPAGTTAAALGGNATDTTVAANAQATTNDSITNNINATAHTGNALASENTGVGNVTSGNANTVVNLLNLENSQLDLSGWFGVLFINVFGNWFGNFGVYVPPAATSNTGSRDTSAPAVTIHKPVFSFVPHGPAVVAPIQHVTSVDTSFANASAKFADAAGQTFGASVHTIGQHLNAPSVTVSNKMAPLQIFGGLLVTFGLTTWGTERVVNARRNRSATATIQQ